MATNPQADAKVHELGQAILADDSYTGRDWSGIALVIQLDGRRRMYGYVYGKDGDWEAETPGFDVLDHADALRQAMNADGKGGWKLCLVQIRRPGPKLNIEFEYDDASRWAVAPADAGAAAERLRPS